MVPSWAVQLLPQLLMEQFDTVDTLNICMKEFGLEKNIFWQNDSRENLDNFLPNKVFVYA